MLNASVEGDELVYHDDVNLGIAVALDEGLIVPGDPPRPSGSASRAWRPRSPTSPSARGRSASSPTRSTAARSRSPTPGSSGRCSRRRSSTSRRSAILDLEAIVKRPVVVDGRERRRFDRDPADDLPAACRGTTGRSTAPRRRGSSPRSRPGSRDGRSSDGDRGHDPRQRTSRADPPASRERSVRSPSTTRSSPSAAASAAASTWSSPSTRPRSARRSGGVRLWHYPATVDAIARRAAAGGRA